MTVFPIEGTYENCILTATDGGLLEKQVEGGESKDR